MTKSLLFTAILLTCLPVLACSNPTDLPTFEITLSAGSSERVNSIFSFGLPTSVTPGNYTLTSQNSETISLQVDENNTAWGVLPYLPAGESVTFTFSATGTADYLNNITVLEAANTLTFFHHQNEILSFFHKLNDLPDELDERYHRAGYIHPVRTPSGTILTDHMNASQHPHHSGIWSAWTNTEFQGRKPDFWNVHQDAGRVDLAEVNHFWSGPVFGGFESVNKFIDLTSGAPIIALYEKWTTRIFAVPENAGYFVFEIDFIQHTAGPDTLFLPEYRYGGVGLRGHAQWTENPETTTFLTSEGLGRDGHGTRAKWAHIGGYTEGNLGGIAVLGHPQNYRFPQTMRIHPREPFFNFAPVQLGDMAIEPGKPYSTRLRFVTYDGEPNAELIERLWQDLAYPVGVTVRVLE